MHDFVTAIKKKRASEEVVKQLVTLIKNGQLKKGDHLPPERDLTEAFKISRTTLREAIRSLELMGLVETRQGAGTYVLVSGEEAAITFSAAGIFTEKDDLRDIFFLREMIEPNIAQLATEFATSSEIKELEEIITKQEMELNSGKSTVDTDTLFHLTLARISKNRVLTRLLHVLMDLMGEIRGNLLQKPQRADKSFKGHHLIVAAIKREDCHGARKAMHAHLKEIENVLFKGRKGGGTC